MAKLEDLQIKSWVKNNQRFEAIADGNGLYLRYRPTDKKPMFYFRFKQANIQQKITLGYYPDLSLSKARKEAIKHRADILKGINPANERKELKQKAIEKTISDKSAQTVAQLVDEYFKRNIEGRLKTAKAIRGRLDKYLIPALGKMRIETVKPIHISNLLTSIVDNGAPTTATDILGYCKQIFNYAIKRHIITNNPAIAFNAQDAGGKEKPRDRFLTEDELINLFKSMRECKQVSDHHYKVTKLLLLLGCRKEELFKAKREDFDLKNSIWNMSSENKTNTAIRIPLSPQALAIVQELMSQRIDSTDYLLPAMAIRKNNTPHINDTYLNKPLKNTVIPLMNVEPFTIHDFRGTMRTHLGKMGVDMFASERCLNHKIPGMVGVYDRGDYFEERNAALKKWGDFLETCELKAITQA